MPPLRISCAPPGGHAPHFGTTGLPYIKLPKMPNHCIFTLKLATAMFAEMDNFQYSTQFIPESQRFTYTNTVNY
jgi:hypothetical protein